MQIGAADADEPVADENLSRPRPFRLGNVFDPQVPGCMKSERAHVFSSMAPDAGEGAMPVPARFAVPEARNCGGYQSEGFIQRHSCGATAVAHASLFLVRLSDAEASHSPVHGGAVDAKPARGLRHIAVAGGQKRAEIGTATVDHGADVAEAR